MKPFERDRDEHELETDVSELLRDDYRAACDEAHPPAAGVVWWRAERRRRDEAARIAARPITVVHALASACAVGFTAALLQLLTPWLRQWLSAAGGLTRVFEWDPANLPAGSITMLAVFVLASLVLAPLALYVALSDDK